MLNTVTKEAFAAHLNTEFVLIPEAGSPVPMTLLQVTGLGNPSSPASTASPRAPFSIVFRAAPNVRLPQRIYRLEHDAMGVMNIFIVPIGPDAQGMRFEAVFA